MDSKHSGNDRPRALVAVFTAADKQGLAFCYGALQAYRDLGLLADVKNIVTSGMANLMIYHLAKTLTGRIDLDTRWRTLLQSENPSPMISTHDSLYTNHELELLKLRLARPIQWMSPWYEATREYVEQRCAHLRDATLDYAVDSSCAMPALTMVGCDPITLRLIAYTTSRQSSTHHTNTATVFGASATDRIPHLAFGLGLPKPFSGVDVPELETLAVSDPRIPIEVADIFYLHNRLDARYSNTDGLDSRRLLLCDASTYATGTDALALTTVQNVLSAPDSKHESLRAYNQTIVQQYDQVHACSADARKLHRHFRTNLTRLESLTHREAATAENWGYLSTWAAHAASEPSSNKRLPVPPFKSEHELFPLRRILSLEHVRDETTESEDREADDAMELEARHLSVVSSDAAV